MNPFKNKKGLGRRVRGPVFGERLGKELGMEPGREAAQLG